MLRNTFILLVIILSALWGATALWYRLPAGMIAAVLWLALAVFTLWSLTHATRKKPAIALYFTAFTTLLIWWCSIHPMVNRDWAPEVAHIATGTMEGYKIKLPYVRNFTWRHDTDYDVKWEARTYSLDDITSVDLFLSYWGMPAIAHTIVSFGFKNGEHIAFSVEIRKEKGESYSNVAGLFKQYELALIAADERDIIYVRSNVRGEDVYRYPLNLSPEARRRLFVAYIEEGRAISETPAFYNTLTANCTTIVFHMVRAIVPGLHIDPRILFSGYLPSYLRSLNGIYKDKPLDQMTAEARVTDKALMAGHAEDFSAQLRAQK